MVACDSFWQALLFSFCLCISIFVKVLEYLLSFLFTIEICIIRFVYFSSVHHFKSNFTWDDMRECFYFSKIYGEKSTDVNDIYYDKRRSFASFTTRIWWFWSLSYHVLQNQASICCHRISICLYGSFIPEIIFNSISKLNLSMQIIAHIIFEDELYESRAFHNVSKTLISNYLMQNYELSTRHQIWIQN